MSIAGFDILYRCAANSFRILKGYGLYQGRLSGKSVNTIGERIVFLREKQGISQKELARQLGITAATLSRYENNLYDPKGEIIVRLSNSLQTSADYLLGITSDYRMPQKSNDLPEKEIFFWELYQTLPPDDRIRIEERILTLHEMRQHL